MKGFAARLPPKYYEMPARYKNCFYLANSSFFDSVNWYLHKAYEVVFPELVDKLIKISGLDVNQASGRILNLIEVLDQCDNLIDVRFPVKGKDGYLNVIRGFKVKHGSYTSFPCGLMGLRIAPDITRDDLKGLGVLSTHRLSAMGIKNVGIFGGIKIESKDYPMEVLKDIMAQYASKCLVEGDEELFLESDMICEDKMTDFIYRRNGNDRFTDWGAQGAFFGMNYFLNNDLISSTLSLPKGICGKTFIIEGLEKMGSNLAVYLQSAGAKCVGVKDYNCHVFNKNGLDVHEVISFKKEHGTLINFELANSVNDFDIYKEECDILVLAAKQKSIVCHFAKSIKAKLIVEAAYHPITPSAYMTLRGHSKIVLPDLLVCGGSAVAAGELLEERLGNRLINSENNVKFDQCTNQVVPKNVLEAIENCGMKPSSSTCTVANVVSNKSQQLLSTCEKYNLGFDFKTAAFIMSITNIFEEIFSSRRF